MKQEFFFHNAATKRFDKTSKPTICAGLSGVKSFRSALLSIQKTCATSLRAIFHISHRKVTDSSI